MPNGYAVFETWFEELTGFAEESPAQVRANISVDGQVLQSRVNGKTLVCGELETPSLAELRQRVQTSGYETGAMTVREVVADVQELHTNAANADALFQVASQFNLLEMVHEEVSPLKTGSPGMRRITPRDQHVPSRRGRVQFIATTLSP